MKVSNLRVGLRMGLGFGVLLLVMLAMGLYAGAFVFSTVVAPSLRSVPSRP